MGSLLISQVLERNLSASEVQLSTAGYNFQQSPLQGLLGDWWIDLLGRQ